MGCLTRIEGGGSSKKPEKGKLTIHHQTGECLPKEKRTSLVTKTVLPKTALPEKTKLPGGTFLKKNTTKK